MQRPAFALAAREADVQPFEFEFGPAGEVFTVLPSPSLGDVFDLRNAPEPSPTTMLDSAEWAARFIRRMLIAEDRPRWDRALYSIDSTRGAFAVVEAATWITEQVTGFPSVPPAESSVGRSTTGTTSKRGTAGRHRSRS